jgi:ABC-type polar amino acid transport system ATPase subunit
MKRLMGSVVLGSIVLCVSPTLLLSANPAAQSLTPTQKQEVGEALRALRKIESIVKVGTSQYDYASRVLDMAATVDESVRHLPDSDLKKGLLSTKDYYMSIS